MDDMPDLSKLSDEVLRDCARDVESIIEDYTRLYHQYLEEIERRRQHEQGDNGYVIG